MDEEDLHSYIVQNWDRTLGKLGLKFVASRFLLGGLAHRQGEIDILAQDGAGIVVVELKNRAVWNTGGETADRQLARYMTHPDVLEFSSLSDGAIRGILIAQEMDHRLRREVQTATLPIIAFEATKAENGLVLMQVAQSETA